jgi:hypothetical protein
MSHTIRIKRTASPGEEKKDKKQLKQMFNEHIHELVRAGKLSRKVDRLMKQGKLKLKVPTMSEIKVNDKAYKELIYVFKLYKIPFKRIQKGIEIDTTKKL